MIDLENVGNRGFDGTELLTADDTVIVFCSKANHFLFGGTWYRLVESRCKVDLYELKSSGHNALDFSIVSCVGELYSKEPTSDIAIVSKDRGYKACRDYWMEQTGVRLLLAANILQSVKMARNRERQQRAKVFEKKRLMCVRRYQN